MTKHLPSTVSNLALEKSGVRPTYYGDLYSGFSKYLTDPQQRHRSPVVQLFCRYLEEEGIVYQLLTPEDDNTLRLLLRQGLGMRGMTGFGKDVTAERQMEVPTLLGTLLTNVQAMGVEFHNRFKDHLGNRFVPKFAFYPSWRINKLSKELEYGGIRRNRSARYCSMRRRRVVLVERRALERPRPVLGVARLRVRA